MPKKEKIPPNAIETGKFFMMNRSMNRNPQFKRGDKVYTHFYSSDDQRIYVVKDFRKKGSEGRPQAVLAEWRCEYCGFTVPDSGWIDASWLLPARRKKR